MDAVTIDTLVQLARSNAWIPLLAVVVGATIRLTKRDVTFLFLKRINTRPEDRALWAMAIAMVGAALDRLAAGGTWYAAIAGGIVAGSGAIAGHEILVNKIRNGRDFGVKKDPPAPPNDWEDDSIRPPAGPKTVYPGPGPKISAFPLAAAVLVLAMIAAVASCSYLGPACKVIDLADTACDLIPVKLADGSIELVPRERFREMAMQVRLERIAAQGPKLVRDGGAE